MFRLDLRNELISLIVGATAILCAGSALAQDRCEGTLCDLYYANRPAPPPAQPATPTPGVPAGAKPLVAPNGTIFGSLFGGSGQQQKQPADGSAPARKPLVAVQGGGLLGKLQGAPDERCSGTLCDLYYGGPTPEKPEPSAERAATGAEPTPDLAPQTEEPSRVIEQPEERHCASNKDPWSCYRR